MRERARGKRGRRVLCLLLAACGTATLMAGPVSAYTRPGHLRQISGPDGGRDATISADGRYVAFNTSQRAAAISYDRGIVRYDRVRDRLEPVSVARVDLTPVFKTQLPSMDASGRFVVFQSTAPNLVPGDTNQADDIFIRDVVAGKTDRVSVADRTREESDGFSAAPSISANGRYVAFQSDATNLTRDGGRQRSSASKVPAIFVRDLEKGRTRRVPLQPDVDLGVVSAVCDVVGNAISPQKFGALSVSNDGRFVAFSSDATNLVPEDTNRDPDCTNGVMSGGWDVYVFDMDRRRIERVSVSSSGEEADGDSAADEGYEGSDIRLSKDGRYVSFQSSAANLIPSDSNGTSDIFVYDRRLDRVERVSVDPIGSEAEDFSARQSLSRNGRYVTFVTAAPNLAGHEGAVVFDRSSGSVDLVSRHARKVTGAEHLYPAVSDDGRFVAFQTTSHLLGDDNGVLDMFLRDRGAAVGGALGDRPPDPRDYEEPCSLEVGSHCFIPICIDDVCVDPGEAMGTSDPSGDVQPAPVAGSDVVGVRMAYRPQHDDVLFSVDVDHLPSVYLDQANVSRPTSTGIVYGVTFRANGKSYELRATWNAGGRFALMACPVGKTPCVGQASLEGSYGTTGNTVMVSLPLGSSGIGPGDRLTKVRAFSALGTIESGALVLLDRARL